MAKKKKKNKKRASSSAAKQPARGASNGKQAKKQPQPVKKAQQAKQPEKKQPAKKQPEKKQPEKTQSEKKQPTAQKPAQPPVQPTGSQQMSAASPGRKRNRIVALIAVVLAAVLLAVGAARYFGYRVPESAYAGYAGRDVPQGMLADIRLTAADQKQHVKQMHAKGDTKAFGFYCSQSLYFDQWNTETTFGFGNISANDCVLIVSIYIPSFNETDCVYRSLGIPPGKELTEIDKLYYAIDEGSYKAKICVAAYDREAPYDLIGVQVADATVVIGADK